MNDVYQRVTDRIIAQLEAGVAPWIKPWAGISEPVPVNATTGRAYRGINHLVLQMEGTARGLDRNAWLTFGQAVAIGGRIRKGSHGVQIVFFQLRERVVEDGSAISDGDRRRIPLLRTFTVFPLVDVEGLPDEYYQPPAVPVWDGNARAEGLIAASGANVCHGGNRAFFRPADDLIQLPERGAFRSADDYFSTALHELVHWTSAPKRCERQLGRRFGDDAYAAEELIAELGAAFLCAHCHIDGQLQHANYIDSWLRVLHSDKRAVFTAAAKAQQAADFILALNAKSDESESMPQAA